MVTSPVASEAGCTTTEVELWAAAEETGGRARSLVALLLLLLLLLPWRELYAAAGREKRERTLRMLWPTLAESSCSRAWWGEMSGVEAEEMVSERRRVVRSEGRQQQ